MIAKGAAVQNVFGHYEDAEDLRHYGYFLLTKLQNRFGISVQRHAKVFQNSRTLQTVPVILEVVKGTAIHRTFEKLRSRRNYESRWSSRCERIMWALPVSE
jgi:hypothetical protein